MPHYRHHRHEPPIPPVPPIPPEPPMSCGGASRSFRIGDVIELIATGPRGWRGGWGPFSFDFGDDVGAGGWGGRGRRARRMFEAGELRLVLLKLVSDQPRHGYDLIRAIEELTGGRYAPSPGVVYPTLTMLDEMGLIEESPGEGARKPYQITDAGRAHLEENEEEADELIRRLKALSPSYSEGGSPIWRAMRNLGVAIRHRVQHGEITEETKFELAALIDELAQKIERLK
ncbi:MAG: PadR family transcriptional regulator [Sphingomicrobium sp.]